MNIFKWMAEVKKEKDRRKGLEEFYRVEFHREWEKSRKAAQSNIFLTHMV